MGFRDLGKGTLERWRLLSGSRTPNIPLLCWHRRVHLKDRLLQAWLPWETGSQCRMRLIVDKCYLFNLFPSSVGWIRRDARSSQNSVHQCTEYLLLSPVWWWSLQSWNARGIGTTSFPSKAEPRSSITQANMLTDPGAGTVLASTPFTLLCSCGSFSRIITCSPLCLPECLS